MCMSNRSYFKEVGDVPSANKFEQMALHSKKDLDAVRSVYKLYISNLVKLILNHKTRQYPNMFLLSGLLSNVATLSPSFTTR